MIKVLIADDDLDILEAVEMILVTKGFEVAKIGNGHKVIDSVKQFKPHVILLDINISDIDGREICKELKRPDSPYKDIPIVLFSAMHNLKDTYSECLASDFIGKPFDSNELVNKLKKHAAFFSN